MIFTFRACDKQGEVLVSTIEAEDEFAAAATLRRLGYAVVSLKKGEKKPWRLADFLKKFGRSHELELVFLSRQLTTLLKSGITLTDSIASIVEQAKDKQFKEALSLILKDLYAGISFSDSMAKHTNIFPELYISMVRVGEASGILDEVMDRLSQIYSQKLEVQMRIRSAVTYPVILLIAAVVIVNFLMVNIVPKFMVIFETYEVELPVITKILLLVSGILQHLWYLVLGIIVIFVIGFRRYIKTEKGAYRFHGFLLKIPFFGQLLLKITLARFSRSLGFLLKSGVPLLDALQTTKRTLTNIYLRMTIENMRELLAEGSGFAELFRSSKVFPPMITQMVTLGEKSGHLDQMLLEVAGFYDKEVEYELKNLTTALEPILLLSIGLMVAFVGLSVLLPIFNLIKVFR